MLALIRMDWTLNRRILLPLTPIFMLQVAMVFTHGLQGLLAAAFMPAALLMLIPVFQNLNDSVEPFLLALPVSRTRIVLARYLTATAALTLTLAAFLILGGVGHRLGFLWAQDMRLPDLVTGLSLQGLFLATVLFLYLPFQFRFEGDLAVSLFAASLGAGLGLIGLVAGWHGFQEGGLALLNRLLDDPAALARALALVPALGAISLGLSVHAYRRRIRRTGAPAVLPTLWLGLVLALFAEAGRVALR